jgi:hypothetical protein
MYQRKSFFLVLLALCSGMLFGSCCTEDGNPDLKLSSQSFPSSARVNQTFQLTFVVANNSTDDCPAAKTTPCQVNLKMVKRGTAQLQVNNFENLDGLNDGETKTFTFSVIIGPDPGPGTYDLTFTIDPSNVSNDAIKDNNVFTSVVIID